MWSYVMMCGAWYKCMYLFLLSICRGYLYFCVSHVNMLFKKLRMCPNKKKIIIKKNCFLQKVFWLTLAKEDKLLFFFFYFGEFYHLIIKLKFCNGLFVSSLHWAEKLVLTDVFKSVMVFSSINLLISRSLVLDYNLFSACAWFFILVTMRNL